MKHIQMLLNYLSLLQIKDDRSLEALEPLVIYLSSNISSKIDFTS